MVKERVCIVGSGNWGSAVGKIVGNNVLRYKDAFEPEVRQWVFQETYKNEKLTDIINRTHENPKYLPGIGLPSNLVAVPDLAEATRDATVLVFVLPHQFVKQVCDDLSQVPLSQTVKAISLIKGLEINSNGVTLFSEEIARRLGLQHVAALSGANIANEVAEEKFCESTIGCHADDEPMYFKLFDTPYFRVQVIRDHAGVQLCGALKNIVAVGAGLSDGLGYGSNTKAAIVRRGLMEMRQFGHTFFGSVVQDNTFFESCGIADLITTCSGGRNRMVSEAFAQTGKSIEELEKTMLNGQKLQGTLTAKEVHEFLSARNMVDQFPLFKTVYRIIYEGASPTCIVTDI
ncbi:NAD-dependent glycerol-3-phosphate dehydrogenase C-terminus-domain-containing protein [Syncephalastrum racemosum]|uniref:Glycerol-3-phosphate dehydrogenase [NAD(+)] n=1 Tax=Syncephalastrum racemosum TaxID=13706 RepID=A0A1X2HAP6_SYNRA|nr:NAD-dependent glycerol-3-phosphate dehydrogenase C-terminus-domain-containing protein [Syncephalastrum racemosum]